jgi:hypothetical protein
MTSLVLPEKVVLRLVDPEGGAFLIRNVLFLVHTFARHKNDFELGPFVSDADGIVTITKRELLAEANATYDSGLMDYRAVEECHPLVEIHAMEPQQVEKALEARTNVWKRLLRGESERWTSIEELRTVYRTSANNRVSVQPLKSLWDGSQSEFEFVIPVARR